MDDLLHQPKGYFYTGYDTNHNDSDFDYFIVF